MSRAVWRQARFEALRARADEECETALATYRSAGGERLLGIWG